ncbi:topoisomerase I [Hortaea werneckii]|nr:topoisomerase I [Hortaea werneckii]
MVAILVSSFSSCCSNFSIEGLLPSASIFLRFRSSLNLSASSSAAFSLSSSSLGFISFWPSATSFSFSFSNFLRIFSRCSSTRAAKGWRPYGWRCFEFDLLTFSGIVPSLFISLSRLDITHEALYRIESLPKKSKTTVSATNSVCLVLAFLVTGTQRELIDKVDCSGTLSLSHDLGLKFFVVVFANRGDVLLQLTSLLELLVIALAFDVRVGSQHHVLVSTIDVLLPHGQPGTFLVVLDFLPLVTLWRFRHHSLLANVDRDLLRPDALLPFACLGVLTTTTEQTGRLNAKVADLLLAAIPHAVHVRGLSLIFFGLQLLLLSRRECLLRLALCIHVVENGLEIALFELGNLDLVAAVVFGVPGLIQHVLEVGEEVLLERRVLDIVGGVEHATESMRNLFGFGMQIDRGAVIQHLDVTRQRLVFGREDNAVMLESGPFLSAITGVGSLPPSVLILLILLSVVVLLAGGLFLLHLGSRLFRWSLLTNGGLFLRNRFIVFIVAVDLLCFAPYIG